MTNNRLSVGLFSVAAQDIVRNWITFTRQLYDEYVQNAEILAIRDRLIYEKRTPTAREMKTLIEIVRAAYVTNTESAAAIARITNINQEITYVPVLNQILQDIVTGAV